MLNDLAWKQTTDKNAKVRDGAQAVRFVERASELLNPKAFSALSTPVVAYAEADQFNQAGKTAQRAIQVIPDSEKEKMEKDI